MVNRLSKWKMRTLSIGGRLTLLKALFGSMPIYHMFIFKEKGGLGVSSLFALNRALMFKWVWRFFNQSDLLWVRVIHAIHGVDGRIGRARNVEYTSIWCDIIKEMDRMSRSGIESEQWDHLLDSLEGVMLNPSEDRWSWDLNVLGEFLVASTRRYIDNNRLPDISSKTRWIKEVPIKVNVHAWKTMNLKNDIMNFKQRFDETFSEAWDHFKDLLRKCPHHDFSEFHQIDTFYNALTQSDQDSLNAAAGGNLLNRTPRDALTIIKNKLKVRSLPSNNVANPRVDVKAITTRSGIAYEGPMIPPASSPFSKEVEHETKVKKEKVLPFDIIFTDALLYMPKFAFTFKSLLSNKEKLFKLASTPLNENCSAVLLKNLPKKLGDTGMFLIPCDFPELEECLALTDLGASINLMPLSVWKKLSLLKLTPTRMTLELTNQSVAYLVGVAEDVFVKVGKFGSTSKKGESKIHEVIKNEVIKLYDAGLIYPIFDSSWVSLVHCAPKKGGMTVVENEDNELLPTRLFTRWCVYIDNRKLNDATRKDHFLLPFMDQMLERLARNEYYCFLDGFLGYFQIPIGMQDQDKTTFTRLYGGHHGVNYTAQKVFDFGFYWSMIYCDAHDMVPNPEAGTYDVESIRHGRPVNIFAVDWDAQIAFWNDPKNLTWCAQNRKNRAKITVEEMLRLHGLGSNTETGVPYTEDEIKAIVRKGKQRGHLLDVGRVFMGHGTSVLSSPPPRCTYPSNVDLSQATCRQR
nr:reverse transcriptase domain-containing protein [Tanacetum cinerariifolium]